MSFPVISFFLLLILLFAGAPIWLALGIPALIGLVDVASPTTFIIAAYNSLDSFTLMAVPFFILSGALMEKGGISRRIVGFVQFFIGGFRGSLCVTACVACAAFGAVSGSAIATSVCVGGIVLPSMKKEGYDPCFSAALLTVAGTIGALIPPSMQFILYGAATGVSVGDLFVAGIIPGLMTTAALSLVAVILTPRNQPNYVAPPKVKRTLKDFIALLADAIWALLVPFIILGGIYGGIFTPTEAGVVACVYAIIAACFIYREMDLKGIIAAFLSSTKLTCQTMFIVALANAYARYLTLENAHVALADFITGLTDSPLVFMLLTTALLLVVGTFMEGSAATMVIAPIIHPIAMTYGIDPFQYAMIVCMALLIGLVTPPVGASLYAMTSTTGLPFLKLAKGCIPFVITFVVVMLLIILVPGFSNILVG